MRKRALKIVDDGGASLDAPLEVGKSARKTRFVLVIAFLGVGFEIRLSG